MFEYDMNKYKKPEEIEAKLGINPFLSSLKIVVNKIKTDDKFKQDGEYWAKADVEFEAVPYTRLYSDSQRRLVMVSLSPRAKDLLLWLMYETKPNKDWLWLNKVRYMEESKIRAVNTYKEALNELIGKCFIVKSVVTDVFWINPHYFYSGSRLRNFPENIVSK